MSRMSVAQIIAIGEYLEPDFDPSTLTVAQLLGIFGFHNVLYPSQYTKPRLIALFNESIKPNAAQFKKERAKRANSQASDDGITDGVTGRPINEGKTLPRRSSRRLSQVPPEEPAVPEPAPIKRRRSSAQPSLGGPSRRKSIRPAEPVLIEESEPEDDTVVRKVGRNKKSSTDAGTRARRVSTHHPEDSGWEDNNVFQSGAESSPVRPSPTKPRTRRSSAVPRSALRSRQSMSEPPLVSPPKGAEPQTEDAPETPLPSAATPSPSPRKRRASAKPRSSVKPPSSAEPPSHAEGSAAKPPSYVKPPSSKFEPRLPPGVARETRASPSKAIRSLLNHEVADGRKATGGPEASKKEDESDPEEKQQIEALRRAIATDDEPEGAVTDDVKHASEAYEEDEVEQEEKVALQGEEEVEGEQEQEVTEEVQEESELEDYDYDEDEDEALGKQVNAVAQRIAEGGQVVRHHRSARTGATSWLVRLTLGLLALTSSGILYEYKHNSATIGFCEAGKASNSILEERRALHAAVESCNRDNRTALYIPDATQSILSSIPAPSALAEGDKGASQGSVPPGAAAPCPPLPLLPLPHPDTCTPCPRHATCTPNTMTCENGYILRSHPILSAVPVPGASSPSPPSSPAAFTRPGSVLSPSADVPELVYSAISLLFDGMPGVGPVALSPRCVEDPRRKRHIGVLGKAVEAMLAAERGRRLCEGVGVGEPEGDDATEAKKWGVELGKLKDELKKRTAPNLLATLDDTYHEAIQQLVQWGGVFMGEDADGKRYLAHRTPTMSLDCALKVKARECWAEWNRSILGSALLVLGVLHLKRRRAQSVVEHERVASLVQIALDLLRNQELAHHTDPVTAPQPYLSSLQLRDLILQDEHSISARQRLWERVERVVEGNANVRTNLEEVQGGDELRVWRWVGSAGAISAGSGAPSKSSPNGK
ncbi:hypothetical protein WOLCODRAFT_136117 [Wolfiporia cocos MD-104 SS10]|uniref:Man1/Src1 C-terminal domain-containing protein n=1 Tax=Wolfiporia cocos (strain MD-104) TaxID=742152 RepID=A0A2H3JHI4_WOLCO|nr:hypothetical protein WOLCODRAFT_136117 [Wolfiporia cocos MD-104 SS10]